MTNEKIEQDQANKLAQIKAEFVEIFTTHIKREGAKELLDFILLTDFFTAPASTRFHSAYAGGLAEHSIKVYKRLLMLVQNEYGENWQDTISAESVAICGLLHDVCKINTYKVEMRNTKENGVWVQKPYFTTEDPMPYGHGEKSVYMVNGFMRLTREEAMAINWHMGPYDMRVKGGSFALSDVFYLYPTAMLMYMADLQAAYLDETTEKFAKKQQEQEK